MKHLRLKAIGTLLGFTLLIALIGGCANQEKTSPGSTAGRVLKMGMTLSKDSHYYAGAAEFARRVEEKSKGTLKVDIFTDAVLGNDRVQAESLMAGTLDMCVGGLGPLAPFVPETQVFGLPFIFKDRGHVARVLDGPTGEKVAKLFEPKGIKYLAYWENGFRHLTNSKRPVKSVADVKGLKIRVMENPVHVSLWKALGADPTPMTWAEVFTALQQGTIDGQENPLAIIYGQKLYEVQKYLTLTGHVYDACAVMMSMSTYNSLTPDQRRIIEETAREVTSWQRAYCEKMEKDLVDKLKEKGMVVSELADPEAFRAKMDIVYKEFEDKYPWAPELIKAVNAQAQ